MTGPPRTLKAHTAAGIKAAYTCRAIEEGILSPGGLQEYTVLPAVPLWLMSPGLRVYRKQDIWTFHGYVKSVTFEAMKPGESPSMTVTITPEPR